MTANRYDFGRSGPDYFLEHRRNTIQKAGTYRCGGHPVWTVYTTSMKGCTFTGLHKGEENRVQQNRFHSLAPMNSLLAPPVSARRRAHWRHVTACS